MSESARILIVDDEATVRKTLELALTAKGFKVIAAASGPAALSLLKIHDVDLMLLDMRMPQMSGNEVLKTVRETYSALELPIIMNTGTDETDAMLRAFKDGANDYLLKPCNAEILAARIDTQLSLKAMNASLIDKQVDLRRDFVKAKVKSELDRVDLQNEIDSRIEAEKALIHSEKRFKVLYDNTPAMYFSLDLDGKILSVNRYAAFVLGYQRKELTGMNIINLYEETDKDTVVQYLENITRAPENLYRWELRKLNRDGTPVLCRETARLVENITGEKNILMVAVDISDEHINIT